MSIVKYKSGDAWVSVATSGAIATRTTYGYVKLASSEDIAEGTNDSAVVTAKQFKDFSDDNFVHKTSNETIAGNKTFSENITFNGTSQIYYNGTMKNTSMIRFIDNTTDTTGNGIAISGGGAVVIGGGESANTMQASVITSGGSERLLLCNDGVVDVYTNVQNGADVAKHFTFNADGTITSAASPAASDNTTKVATTAWCSDASLSTNLVHRTGDETIGGQKTFTTNTYTKSNVYIYANASLISDASRSAVEYNRVGWQDKNNTSTDIIQSIWETNGTRKWQFLVRNNANTGWEAPITVSTPVYSSTVTASTVTANLEWTFSNTIKGTAYRALWGDLAEYYLTDVEYPKGTLVQFGGEKEITIAKNKVNAVITSEPGFILNGEQKDSQAIALIGRVPVRIIGKVKKFDKIALSYIDGVGCVNNETEHPIGIALESKDDADESLIICSVKIDF